VEAMDTLSTDTTDLSYRTPTSPIAPARILEAAHHMLRPVPIPPSEACLRHASRQSPPPTFQPSAACFAR
jgi:hypothetical protein